MTTRARPSAIAMVAVVATLLVTFGCSSSAKQKLADSAKGPVCTAITNVQDKVTGDKLQDLTPDQLTAMQAQAQSATQAVDALGDKVPASLSSGLDQAQAKLNSALEDTKASAEQRKANLKSAGDDYVAKLDSVKSDLGC